MEEFKKLQKMHKKLKRHFTMEIIFVIILFLAAIIGALAGFEVIHIHEDIMWGVLIATMIPIIILTGGINFLREHSINYFKQHKSIFLRKAILYNQDAVMNCANNSFLEIEKINEAGVVYFVEPDSTIPADRYENVFCFSGDYKDVHIEGCHVFSYFANLEYRRKNNPIKQEADRFENRMDRSQNSEIKFYTVGEANNITFSGVYPVMIYHKDFYKKRLFKDEKFRIFPMMSTGNATFDNMYEVKTIDPDKVKALFTDDFINSMIEIGEKGKPVGLRFYEGKVAFAIETRKMNPKKEAMKTLDFDNEYAESVKMVDMYMRLIKSLKIESV